jgi:hypothetical protein
MSFPPSDGERGRPDTDREATPPASTARLFRDGEPIDLHDRSSRNLAIGRLLEEGERDDLRWLAATVGEEELAGWLERRGPRRLSRRSLRFWRLMLDREELDIDPAREELWPL